MDRPCVFLIVAPSAYDVVRGLGFRVEGLGFRV